MLALVAQLILGIGSTSHEPTLLTGLSGCTDTPINVAAQCEIRARQNLLPKSYTYPHDFHTMAIYIFYDRGGGSGYTFHADVCIEGFGPADCTDSTDWFNIMAQTTSTNYTDLDQKIYRRSVSVDDYSVMFMELIYPRVRFHTILCTGGGCNANDKITISVGLHEEPVGLVP